MGSTVEVGPVAGLAPGVGVVVVRPESYAADPGGLKRYVRDFNRQVELTRGRASAGCKTLDALAFAPARIATTVLYDALHRGGAAFGSLGLTMLKDARVFGAPSAGEPHANGFIAVGSMALPTAGPRRVGCVWAKGPPDRVADYPAVVQEAVNGCPAPSR